MTEIRVRVYHKHYHKDLHYHYSLHNQRNYHKSCSLGCIWWPHDTTRVMSVVCTQQTNQPYSGKQLWWYLTSQPKEEKSQYW